MVDKNYLLQITNELYRLTLLFPKKEPLRYKMRELADDILAQSIRNTNQYEYTNQSDPSKKCNEERARYIEENLEVLDGFFEVAKNQNWIKPEDLLNLQEEYSKLKGQLKLKAESIKSEVKLTGVRPLQKSELTGGRPLQNSDSQSRQEGRQEKSLTFLKEKEKAQVWQIKQIFPQTSKRTLRRDFENLFKRGIIERIGERNETFYQLKEG